MYRLKFCRAMLMSLLLGGGTAILCAQPAGKPPASTLVAANTEPSASTNTDSSRPQLVERYPRYVIQRQDVLLLTFPLTPEMNQTVTVQPDGYINLQSAGSVHVQGLTVPELTAALKTAYTNVLHSPIIDVDLKDFQKPFFTVSGQVGKPGRYDLRSDITIAEALAEAGGMTPNAKTQVFLFHRSSTHWVAVRKVNMKDILKGKQMDEDAMIQPGDQIYVPEKFITNFKKYVPYSVSSGTYWQPTPF